MKVIRATVYPPDSLSPATVVMRQCDAAVPLEEIGEDEDGFVITDIFEVPDEQSFGKTVLDAMERVNLDDERNQAIMYYWLLGQFNIFADGAFILSDIPAPLTVEQIQYVHRALKRHTAYRGFTFSTFAKDGTPVETTKEGQTP